MSQIKPLSKELLERLYCRDKLSDYQIARRLKCSRQKIQVWRTYYGIPARTRSEATALAKGSLFNCNEQFLDIWSPEMAWVLGLFYADGTVRCRSNKPHQAALSSKDRDLLEQVNQVWQADFPIIDMSHYPSYRWKGFALRISGQSRVQALMNYGLFPNKAATMKFPNVPEHCLSHFVRGLWDGDGSFYIENETHSRLYATYACVNRPFIEAMIQIIASGCDIRIPNILPRRGTKLPQYQIYYTQRDEVKHFATWLYYGSSDKTRLARKYDIVQPFLGKKSEFHTLNSTL